MTIGEAKPGAGPAEPIRIAIVGTGNIARSRAATLRQVAAPGAASIVAAADVDDGRLSAFRDAPGNFSHPSQWFVRSTPFACLCPAPFFDAEYTLAAGAALTLRYDIAVADGALDSAACARLTGRAATRDLLGS